MSTADAERPDVARPAVLTLESAEVTAVIVPSQGGRVASIVDRRSGREQLYQQRPHADGSIEYLQALAGGWDQMFPTDDPDFGYPTHGVLWSTPFQVSSSSPGEAVLRATLTDPAVRVEYRYALQAGAPALRMTVDVEALAAVGPFLWNSHPMLAIEDGWLVEVGAQEASVDPVLPGRFAGRERIALDGLDVPARGLGMTEVLYVDGVSQASVRSPDGLAGARVRWTGDLFRHLWICSVSADDGIDHALVLEASTSAAFQLPRALEGGTAASMAEGERASWSVTLESLDRPGA